MSRKLISDIYPLSPLQEGILYHYLSGNEPAEYFEQNCITIQGCLDLEIFQLAWNQVIADNEILRTVFRWMDIKKPLQIVLSQRVSKVEIVDLSNLSPDRGSKSLEQICERDRQAGFNLAKGPLSRIKICLLARERLAIIWSYHHIIMDGWSAGLFFKELFLAYQRLLIGERDSQGNKLPFKEYIKFIEARNVKSSLDYWKEYLHGFTTPTSLTDQLYFAQEQVCSRKEKLLAIKDLWISEDVSQRLSELSKKLHVTVNVITQTAWGLLLQKYNNCRDVVFGVTVSGRPAQLSGIEDSLGLFINTLPLRVQSHPDEVLADLLTKQMSSNLLREEALYVSLTEILKQSQVKKRPLFDNLLIFENYPLDQMLYNLPLGLKIVDLKAHEMTNYDLVITASFSDQLRLRFSYHPRVFPKEMISQIAKHFNNLLYTIANDPEIKVRQLDLLSVQEKKTLLKSSTGVKMVISEDKFLHQLFEEQVIRTPDARAIVWKDSVLTYSELNQKADLLAKKLSQFLKTTNSIVPILIERSLEMVISLFAILKAGGAYLPLDPIFPSERISYMLKDSSAETLLVSRASLSYLPASWAGKTIIVEEIEDMKPDFDSFEDLSELSISSTPLAYLIYTSGSTGQPKGVMIEHSAVVNFMSALKEVLPFVPQKKFLALTTISFDISVLELFLTLASGLEVVIASEKDQRDPRLLQKLLHKEKIQMVQMTPSTLQLLGADGLPDSLEVILLGGEPLPIESLRQLQEKTRARIFNMYGPTETTIWSTYQELTTKKEVDLGYPIANTSVYILDQDQHLLPPGVIGEIYIAGKGVARGYLHQEQLTNEKFISNPFQLGERMYQTGDLGCHHRDGYVTFHGRVDDQVKIRGFRVELPEIESVLNTHLQIDKSLIRLQQRRAGDLFLVAYLVLKTDQKTELTVPGLREYLREFLPEYMVPSQFLILEKFPLTPNGKLDRQALPHIDGDLSTVLHAAGQDFPPRNQTEKIIRDIWLEVLEKDVIGINDNFFDLGGHSLMVTRAISRINQAFEVDISFDLFLDNPTIIDLAEKLNLKVKRSYQQIIAQPTQKYYPVTHAQRRLWIIHALEAQGSAYHLSSVYRLKGQLDLEVLKKSFQTLYRRYEILRTGFRIVENQLVQFSVSDLKNGLQYHDLSMTTKEVEKEVRKRLQEKLKTPFDLQKPGLLRIYLCKLTSEEYLFLINLHHIITDEWSNNLLFSELLKLYAAYLRGQPDPLRPLRIQYRDYAVWQKNLLNSAEIDQLENYWLNHLTGELPVLNFPSDLPRPRLKSSLGDYLTFELGDNLVSKLKKLSHSADVTFFMVLLTAYYILLHRYTDQNDLIVGIPVANRQNVELENQIGFFVNSLALRLIFTGQETYLELLNKVKEVVVGGLVHQAYPFDLLVERLNYERNPNRSPIFDTMFNFNPVKSDLENSVGGLEIEAYPLFSKTSKFDLSLNIFDHNKNVYGGFEYCTALFEPETVKRFVSHWLNLLTAIAVNPNSPINQLQILQNQEIEILSRGWPLADVNLLPLKTLRSFANGQVYLLDGNLKPVPQGVIGELYFGLDKTVLERHELVQNIGQRIITYPLHPDLLLYKSTERARLVKNQIILWAEQDSHIAVSSETVEYVLPKTALQKKLVTIWQDILQLERVGIDDSFFDLGGTSLEIVILYEKVKPLIQKSVTVADLFSYYTIGMFSEYVENIPPDIYQSPAPEEELDQVFEKMAAGELSPEDAARLFSGGE